jgi:hypothetical protein
MRSKVVRVLSSLGLVNKSFKLKVLNKNERQCTGYTFSHLLRNNLSPEEVKLFAFHTPAEMISTMDFRILLERGPKYIVNFFLQEQKHKTDYLDFEKVAAILHVSGLQFLNKNKELELLGTLERANYIIASGASLTPDAVHSLILNKELALATIAKRPEMIINNRHIAETIAIIANLATRDVLGYCENPYLLKASESSFSKIDFLYLEALKKAA